MMRKVFENEIHGLDFETMISVEEFLQHIAPWKRGICKLMHHVDTQLHQEGGKLHWRVQGYINVSDFKELSSYPEKVDAYIGIGADALEIWSLVIPYYNK